MLLFRAIIVAVVLAGSLVAHADTAQRTFVLREKAVASFLSGAFSFKLVRIDGYSVVVRITGKNRKLKVDQSFSPSGTNCKFVFKEIATETRIARFSTNCS